MLDGDEHAVQVIAAGIGKVVGAVKEYVGVVLGIGVQDQLRCRPTEEAIRAGKANRTNLHPLFESADPDTLEALGREAPQLNVSVIVAVVLVVAVGYAAIDQAGRPVVFRCASNGYGRVTPTQPDDP